MEKYPVYIQGDEKGTLAVTREGLLTVFTARCPQKSGMVKLSIFGDGKSAYLGTMRPDGDGLYLQKKLSRTELAAFPQTISYAADAELEPAETDTLWHACKGGVLKSADGAFVAFPCAGNKLPGERLRRINGRDYMIFSAKCSGRER